MNKKEQSWGRKYLAFFLSESFVRRSYSAVNVTVFLFTATWPAASKFFLWPDTRCCEGNRGPHVCPFCFPHDWSHQILPSSVRAGATRIFTKNVTETVTTAAYDYVNSAGGILNCSYVNWTCTDGSRYHRQACSMPTQYPHRGARFSPEHPLAGRTRRLSAAFLTLARATNEVSGRGEG